MTPPLPPSAPPPAAAAAPPAAPASGADPPTARAAPGVRRLLWCPAPGRRREPKPPPSRPPTPAVDDPVTRRAIAATLRLACEVLDGRRDAGQLAPLLSPPALRYWRAAACARPSPTATRLLRVRVCRPAEDAAEVAAVCDRAGRVAALAARFDRRRGTWRCTAIRLG